MSSSQSPSSSPIAQDQANDAAADGARPSKTEYAAYHSLLRTLTTQEDPLAGKLALAANPTLASRPGSVEGESELGSEDQVSSSSGLSSGLEEEYIPSDYEQRPRRSKRMLRRTTNKTLRTLKSSESIVRRQKPVELDPTPEGRQDDTWPLAPKQVRDVSLDEVIRDLATKRIQRDRLYVPPIEAVQSSLSAYPLTPLSIEDDDNLNDDITEIVTRSTKEYINRVLAIVAEMRPMTTGTRRRRMGPINWEGVMSAASLLTGEEEIARDANELLRDILIPDTNLGDVPPDLVAHRLDVMERYNFPILPLLDLYGAIPLEEPKAKRRHQNQKEVERRAAKRAEKEKIRAAKVTAKAEEKAKKAQARLDAKAAKKQLAQPSPKVKSPRKRKR